MTSMTEAHRVQQAIMFGNFTNDELNSIADAIRFARSSLTKQTKRELRLGTTVSFNNTRLGRPTSGIVTKIGRKFATIQSNGSGLWRVPMNMLTVQ